MASNAFNLENTYVYFDVRNYTNRSVLSSYALANTPLTCIPDFTTSELVSSVDRGISTKVIRWDFGDDTFSSDLTAVHAYKWPGEYTITLTVFDRLGNALESTYKPSVRIQNFIADAIDWKDYGKLVYDVPASKIGDPITVITRNSWQSYNALSAEGITINLFASGAAGQYIGEENFFNDKWSHLRLLSRFYEIQNIGTEPDYVIVDTITAKTTEIYARVRNNDLEICSKDDEGSIFVGVTAENDVYYVDDKVKNFTTRENPIFLAASFDTAKFEDEFSQRREIYSFINYPPAGFQAYKPAFLPIIKVRHNPAEHLSISTTGIDGEGTLSTTVFNIPEISWQCTPIPFVVKFKDFDGFTTKTYDPLSSSQINTSIPPQSGYDLRIGLVALSGDTIVYPISNIKWYEDFDPDAPQSIGGFYKGYFISNQTANTCMLTAEVTVVDPVNFPKDTLIGWIGVPQYGYAMRVFRQQIFDNCFGSVQVTLSSENAFSRTADNRNIYSIAVAASGAGKNRDYQTWLADNTSDRVIKIDAYGNTLSSIDLSNAATLVNGLIEYRDYRTPVLSCASPSSIALDSNQDLWVALYDSAKIIKIDYNNGYIKNVINEPGTNVFFLLSSDYNIPELSGFVGEGLFLPSCVDTDKENNIWVAYSHPLSNFIMKYDTEGVLLTTIVFPQIVDPIEICNDRDGYVWLTTYNHNSSSFTLTGRNDFVYKFTSTGELVPGFPLSGFRMLNNITVDGNQNGWVSHDRQTLSRIDKFTNEVTNYSAGSANKTSYLCSLLGITCDSANYIWALNDYEKKFYIIDSQLPPASAFNTRSTVDLRFPPVVPAYPVSGFELNQFQAYGDWFGYRWINKYMVPYAIIRTVSGTSNTFTIYPSSGQYGVTKINENWGAEEFYKNLRYQEILLDKEKFFTEFLGSIIGDIKSLPYEFGKTIYERIANFVDNKANITTCNLETLLSFCRELTIPFEEYNYPFPPQLRRLIDIFCVKHKNLWGDYNQFNENFAAKGTLQPNVEYGVNLGSELSIYSSVISSGYPIVAFETFAETYKVVNFIGIPDTAIGQELPLSAYSYDWGWNLVAPRSISGIDINIYYKFYSFVPKTPEKVYNSLLDWTNPQTTVKYTQSSFDIWAGDNGIMQNMISYELAKGLRLFTSAANITYNN